MSRWPVSLAQDANGRFAALSSPPPLPAFGRSATRAADWRCVITRQFAPPFQARHPLQFRGTARYSQAWNGRVAIPPPAGSWSVCISTSLSSAVAYACRSSLCPIPIVEPRNQQFGRIVGWTDGVIPEFGLEEIIGQRPRCHALTVTDVAHTQLNQIAGSELTVDRQVE